jgi:hypothetical protein
VIISVVLTSDDPGGYQLMVMIYTKQWGPAEHGIWQPSLTTADPHGDLKMDSTACWI